MVAPTAWARMRRCANFSRLRAVACALLLASWALRAVETNIAPPPNELGRLVVKNFAPRDFVGNGQVWQIAEDDEGLLYFGNGPGLVTYDGATWRRVATEKPTDITRAVVRAPDGKSTSPGKISSAGSTPARACNARLSL